MRRNALLMMLSNGRMTMDEMIAHVLTDESGDGVSLQRRTEGGDGKRVRRNISVVAANLRDEGLVQRPTRTTYELTEEGKKVVNPPDNWWEEIL